MHLKWKVLIGSIIVYQIVLTHVVLKLAQYSQTLYFSSEIGITHRWYEGGMTVPMRSSVIMLGVVLVSVIVINVLVFKLKKKEK